MVIKLVQLKRHTRPLRVLIAFKRCETSKLQQQLADLLEVHADSASYVRKTESRISELEDAVSSAAAAAVDKDHLISTLEDQVREWQAKKVCHVPQVYYENMASNLFHVVAKNGYRVVNLSFCTVDRYTFQFMLFSIDYNNSVYTTYLNET